MSDQARPARQLTRRRKLLFAAAILGGIFLLMELLLRLFGALAPVPLFSEFKDASGRDMVRFNPGVIEPEFARHKGPGVYRIMIAGGSTSIGFPFHPRSSFGIRLERLLEDQLPGIEFEVIHVGKMSMHSGEVAEVAAEALAFEPDLLIVYSGQNEFLSLHRRVSPGLERAVKALSRLRVMRLAGGVGLFALGKSKRKLMRAWEEGPEQAVRAPVPARISRKQYDRVLREYRENLTRMARSAKAKGVPIIFCTMTSNLRDWPPELYAFPPEFDHRQRTQARAALAKARAMLEAKHYDEAVEFLTAAGKEFPGYAPLTFYLGRARSGLLFYDLMASDPESGVSAPELSDPQAVRAQAFADLRQAISEESKSVFSHRAPPELNRIVKEMAADQGALLLDVERAIETATYLPPGFDWFKDHCHPSLMGQQAIAEAIADFMKAHGLPRPAAEWEEPSPWDEAAFQSEQGMDEAFFHQVYHRGGQARRGSGEAFLRVQSFH